MSLPVLETPVKFHLSLNVRDLGRSLAFYRVLFGREPAKQHDDYAKFELDDPPLVFSLVPRAAGSGGVLSHLGLRVADDAAIEAVRARLAAAGICTQEQNGTVCGYARKNKCWVKDPDDNFWEVYVLEEDVDPASVRRSLEGPSARLEPTSGPVVWEHFVTEPLRGAIPHADGAVDEVRLTGTFNADLSDADRSFLLREAVRVLRPGGKVVTHGLMADRPFVGAQPRLPGLAAMVARVPVQSEPLDAFAIAGLVAAQVVKYTEKPWFVHAGAELREVKVVAWKPESVAGVEHTVLYKGPFREAKADGGWTFPRGQRIAVPETVWRQLRLGAAAEQFLFLEPGQGSACGEMGASPCAST
jgi:catechol 2,3-dioxygenase-like lactoylglutathione lyase family enzyme